MNYKEAVNTILDIASNHKMVNEVGYGDIYEHLNSGEHKYPCVFLTVENVGSDPNATNVINATLFYVDRLTEDSSNKLDIQSFAITVLEFLTNQYTDVFLQVETTNITLFTEKFADLTAGGYIQIGITYNADNIC